MQENLCHKFIPSRVEGAADVWQVFVFPNRLELIGLAKRSVIRFADIARWPRPEWLWRALFAGGIRPRWLPVADRDWFHMPRDRFFRFYTNPSLVLYMPVDEVAGDYAVTHFFRIQQVIYSAGFHTVDLG